MIVLRRPSIEMPTSRRDFLHRSASAFAGATFANALPGTFGAKLSRLAPSDQLNVGVIGANGMGWSDM